MALEKVGVGGVLSFDAARAVAGMNRAKMSFDSLSAGAKKFKTGISGAASGLGQLSIVGAGASLVLGSMAKTAIEFEHQMSGVKAISQASAAEMLLFEKQAKKLGATTAFTAVQAGAAQENLSRAGFKVNEVLSATPAILNAAAAEGMDLAQASEIVANVLRGMRIPAEEANRVSDVLALTSAKANTNIVALGEAFTYAAPQAASLGFTFEETASALGKVADAGLKGSIGGTSLTNMFVKLSKPSSKATALMKKWGIQLENADGSIRPLSDIVGQFKTKVDAIPNATERAGVVTELFGIRGQKAFNALSAAGPEALAELTGSLNEAEGAAKRMADTRLDNIQGAITILKSAWEGLSIEVGNFLLKNSSVKAGIKAVTGFISELTLALQGETEVMREVNGKTVTLNLAMTTAGKVAKGMKEGLEFVTSTIKSAARWVSDLGAKFGLAFGGDTITMIAKIGMILTVVLAALAPIGAAVFVLGIAFSGIGSIITGVGTALAALWGPLGIVAAGLAAGLGGGFLMIRQEGETTMETLSRVFKFFSAWIKMGIENVKAFAKGFSDGIAPSLENISGIVGRLAEKFQGVTASIQDLVKDSGVLETNWEGIGKSLGDIGTTMSSFIGPTIESVAGSFIDAGKILSESIIPSLKGIWNFVKVIGSILMLPFLGQWIVTLKVIWPLVGLIFKGVVSIVGKVIELVAWIGNKLAPVWDVAVAKVQSFLGWIGKVWDVAVAKVQSFLGWIGKVWEFVKGVEVLWFEMIAKFGTALGERLQPYVAKARDFILATWEKIAGSASDAWNWITGKVILPAWNWIKGIAGKIQATFTGAFQKVRDVAAMIFGKLTLVLAAPFQKVLDFIKTIITAISGTSLGKAALAAAGVTAGAIGEFQTSIAKFVGKTFGTPTKSEAAKAVEEGTTAAAEKSPATKAMQAKAEQQGQVIGAQQPCVTVDNKVGVNVDNKLSVDGSEMSIASAKHQAEVSERAGFSTTPWQKRKILETGAIPATGGVPS